MKIVKMAPKWPSSESFETNTFRDGKIDFIDIVLETFLGSEQKSGKA